ncbi:MAG: twin-arginine translocation signal domain-containing protein, partial [Desulfovibrionales bacterium]|nr:twin-arginine translocation signal domain-containing protein [Desulfovibrionales bacterium]
MDRRKFLKGSTALVGLSLVSPLKAFSFPTVFPHGTTIYKPEKCYSGYTVFGTEVE